MKPLRPPHMRGVHPSSQASPPEESSQASPPAEISLPGGAPGSEASHAPDDAGPAFRTEQPAISPGAVQPANAPDILPVNAPDAQPAASHASDYVTPLTPGLPELRFDAPFISEPEAHGIMPGAGYAGFERPLSMPSSPGIGEHTESKPTRLQAAGIDYSRDDLVRIVSSGRKERMLRRGQMTRGGMMQQQEPPQSLTREDVWDQASAEARSQRELFSYAGQTRTFHIPRTAKIILAAALAGAIGGLLWYPGSLAGPEQPQQQEIPLKPGYGPLRFTPRETQPRTAPDGTPKTGQYHTPGGDSEMTVTRNNAGIEEKVIPYNTSCADRGALGTGMYSSRA